MVYTFQVLKTYVLDNKEIIGKLGLHQSLPYTVFAGRFELFPKGQRAWAVRAQNSSIVFMAVNFHLVPVNHPNL